MERSDEVREEHQDDDDGNGDKDQDQDQDDENDHDRRTETIENSLFGGQGPKKLARIMKNLLGLGVKDRIAQRQHALREANRSIYLDICTALSVTHDDRLAKSDLHILVVEAVSSFSLLELLTLMHFMIIKIDKEPEFAYEKLAQYADLTGQNRTKYAVLGKDVMAHIWSDMVNCQIPSWISPAPRNWGTTQMGKLSADNWRVICTIHLPTSLIWLWRNETGRKQELLANLMDLVTAVRLANLRICSSAVIEDYNRTMSRYLQGLLDLFPHEALKPNHHAALHIGDVMERFGPGHSHGSAYYERHIALFHRINTNRQLGNRLKSMLLSKLTYKLYMYRSNRRKYPAGIRLPRKPICNPCG